MATLADLQDYKANLVLKPLRGAVLLAPMTAAVPVSFTTGAGGDLVNFSGYSSLGHIAREAPPTFTPETESNAVQAWGVLDEVREDMIRRTLRVGFTPIETNKHVLSVYENVILDAVTADATSGEVNIDIPITPQTIDYRAIFLAVDGAGDDEIYFGRFLPRCSMVEAGAENWAEDQAASRPVTFKAKVDSSAGYSSRLFFGGPGWQKRVEAAGFSGYTYTGS